MFQTKRTHREGEQKDIAQGKKRRGEEKRREKKRREREISFFRAVVFSPFLDLFSRENPFVRCPIRSVQGSFLDPPFRPADFLGQFLVFSFCCVWFGLVYVSVGLRP